MTYHRLGLKGLSMTNSQLQKIKELENKLPDMSFEIFKDGVIILNYQTKKGVKISPTDLSLPLEILVGHVISNTHLIN